MGGSRILPSERRLKLRSVIHLQRQRALIRPAPINPIQPVAGRRELASSNRGNTVASPAVAFLLIPVFDNADFLPANQQAHDVKYDIK